MDVKRHALRRTSRAAIALKKAAAERDAAIHNARVAGCSLREIATAAELTPGRIHQIVASPIDLYEDTRDSSFIPDGQWNHSCE